MTTPVGLSVNNGDGTSSGSIGLPAGTAEGDRILVYLILNDWTEVGWSGNAVISEHSFDAVRDFPEAHLFVSEPLTAAQLVTQTFDFIGSTSRWWRAVCLTLRDAPLITVGTWGNQPTTGTDTTAPSVNVPVDDHDLFGFYGIQGNNSYSAPVGMTKLQGFNEGFSRPVAVFQEDTTLLSGASGTRTATLTNSDASADRRNVLVAAGPEDVAVFEAEAEGSGESEGEAEVIAVAPSDGGEPAPGESEWSAILSVTTTAPGGGIEFPLLRVDRDVINDSHIPTPVVLRIFGNIVDPVVHNMTTGESLGFTGTIPEGSFLEIDTSYGEKSVTLVNESGERSDAFSMLNLSNADFWWMRPGLNRILLDFTENLTGRVQLLWRTRFAGT